MSGGRLADTWIPLTTKVRLLPYPQIDLMPLLRTNTQVEAVVLGLIGDGCSVRQQSRQGDTSRRIITKRLMERHHQFIYTKGKT